MRHLSSCVLFMTRSIIFHPAPRCRDAEPAKTSKVSFVCVCVCVCVCVFCSFFLCRFVWFFVSLINFHIWYVMLIELFTPHPLTISKSDAWTQS